MHLSTIADAATNVCIGDSLGNYVLCTMLTDISYVCDLYVYTT